MEPNISTGPGSLGVNRMAYEFDYFSGSQIGVYIGDLLIDDIDTIQFTVTQSKRPIYGYASQYYHTVSQGQVLVEGIFSIPFKEADYIIAALQRYREASVPISVPNRAERVRMKGALGDGVPLDYRVNRENIERRLANSAKKDLPDYALYNSLAAMPDQQFEDIAEVFEDALWKNPDADYLSTNLSINDKQNLSDAPVTHRRADQYPDVDIFILYGDIANAAANHTIKKLCNVTIVGQGQAISVGGQPIQEQYRFIAQNLA